MSKLIPLTQGQQTIVDDEDYTFLMQWKWYCHQGYARRTEGGGRKARQIHMHRIILKAPENMEVDHIDGDKLNNQKVNLRLVSHASNTQNARPRKDGRSPFKGVIWHSQSNKWRPRITVNHRRIHLGYFTDEIEAAKAYDHAARKYHGEFARLNFPNT